MPVLKFLTDGDILEKKVTGRPVSDNHRTGYGKDIPTRIMVRLKDSPARWRRVYCAVYANSGTAYVKLPNHTWGVVPYGV